MSLPPRRLPLILATFSLMLDGGRGGPRHGRPGAALLVCDVVISAVGVAGAELGGGGLRVVDGIWQGLDVGLIAWVWGACAGFIAQRTRSRVAVRSLTALLVVLAVLGFRRQDLVR